jgi:ribosome-associated heat shock protein Hsp15
LLKRNRIFYFVRKIEVVRLDKWLWAVRIFKTRNQSTEACRRGRVLVNGMPAKASKEMSIDDRITVRKPPVVYSYRVKELIERRVSAKLVPQYLEDLTSLEELDKLKVNEAFFFTRERGTGRPTKKDRRLMDKLKDNK